MVPQTLTLACLACGLLNAATLTGKIQDERGTALEPATFTLWQASAPKGLQSTTQSGRFTYSELTPATYFLKVESPGRSTAYGALHLAADESRELNPVLLPGSAATVQALPPYHAPDASLLRDSGPPPKIKGSHLRKQVTPAYPPSLAKSGIGGKVSIAATLRKDGSLDDLIVLSAPHKDLALAALAAVLHWRYTPTLVDNQPVEVYFTVEVNFRP